MSGQTIFLAVKIVPKSSSNQILGWEGEELKIKIAAVPEKGEANEELIHFLAKTFKIAKSQIQLVKGQTSRHKKLRITNLSEEDIQTIKFLKK